MQEDKTIPCLICKNNSRYIGSRKGYREPEIFRIFYCEKCNTCFSVPRPTGDEIYQLIYSNAENVPGYNRYWQYQERVQSVASPLAFLSDSELSYWAPITYIKNQADPEKHLKILEIGSGLGYLTYALNKEGYECTGIDISMEAVERASAKFGQYYQCADLFEYAKTRSSLFDMIVMTELIEHIDDPVGFISVVKKMLKETGTIILTTPNKSFYPDGIIWNTDSPPVHCWWFSEESINQIASLIGMDVQYVNFSGYYKRNPLFYNIENSVSATEFIFNVQGEVNSEDIKQKKKQIIPAFVKNTWIYKILLRFVILRLFPKKFKSGGSQSPVICAILSIPGKNKN